MMSEQQVSRGDVNGSLKNSDSSEGEAAIEPVDTAGAETPEMVNLRKCKKEAIRLLEERPHPLPQFTQEENTKYWHEIHPAFEALSTAAGTSTLQKMAPFMDTALKCCFMLSDKYRSDECYKWSGEIRNLYCMVELYSMVESG